jgi:hypothetical protein
MPMPMMDGQGNMAQMQNPFSVMGYQNQMPPMNYNPYLMYQDPSLQGN